MQAYYEKILFKKEQSGICWDLLFFKKGSGMTQGNVYLSAVFGLILFGSMGVELGINNYHH